MADWLLELLRKNVEETDTDNMGQRKRSTARACCRDFRVVDLPAASTGAFAMILPSCAMNLQFEADAEMR